VIQNHRDEIQTPSSTYNVCVPFTFAHVAAALPFRRLGLVPSALVVGTFAPDFWYFLGFESDRGLGHTLFGGFVLTPLLALIVLWIFHAFVKVPIASLLPNTVQSRLVSSLDRFRFWGPTKLAVILGSILLGILTHLLWDSFTHPTTWLYHHWPFLSYMVRLPIVGLVPNYKLFQHGSTIVGTAILLIWSVRWYQVTEPCREYPRPLFSSPQKLLLIVLICLVALFGAVARSVLIDGVPMDSLAFKRFVGQAIVSVIALMWWEFVAFGLLYSKHVSTKSPTNYIRG
jgi:hypothetical protein